MPFYRRTKEEAKEQLNQLIDLFQNNLKQYKDENYLEANVKKEFIEKFLMILNWDVNNENGVAPQYKEVICEARTQEKGVIKHPDYALCIGGVPVFYVEAKPPSVKVLNADKYALQLKKYAFSTKKPLSILTDFEEFSVYDTRKQPDKNESAEVSRIKYLTFDKYIEEFDYLWDVFSYDSVIKGSITNFFEKNDGNYGVNDINEEILEAIEEWRVLLIKSIHSKKGNITDQNVNMAIQRLINRFVYIWRTKGY